MRPELNQYELIESYLSNTLSKEQHQLFQKQLSESSDLQEQVEFQSLAIQAARRIGLRAEIANARGKSGGGLSTKIIIGIIIGLLALTSTLAYLFTDNTESKKEEKKETTAPETQLKPALPVSHEDSAVVESVVEILPIDYLVSFDDVTNFIAETSASAVVFDDGELNTWIPLEKQVFPIDPKKGGTVEGKDGTLIIVPTNAFVDAENKIVTDNVDFELVEALKWEDMIAYNLTTTNDGEALSTAGMIRVQAFVDGKQVSINPNRPVYIEIPTNDFDPNMMAWEGEVKNGDINWKNPAPLKKYLTKVDLDLLDFLPEDFDLEVEAGLPFNGHDEISKELVDSLYYALSSYLDMPGRDGKSVSLDKPIREKELVRHTKTRTKDQEYSFNGEDAFYCYLDPLNIKTIRTDKFKNSFIATKEFESRIQALHKIPQRGQRLLNIYIENLDKDLYLADEKVAKLLTGKDKEIFQRFAGEKATNVEGSIYDKQLQAYYNSKRKSFAKAQKKLHDEYRDKTTSELNKLLESVISRKGKTQSSGKSKGKGKTNVKTAVPMRSAANQATYSTPWFKSSWVNIDSYLHLLSKGTPVEVQITAQDNDGYSKIYQSNGFLKTIISLNFQGGKAKAQFPDQKLPISSSMVNSMCVGISKKDDEIFYSQRRYNPYKTSNLELKWQEVSSDELYSNLKSISPYASKMIQEIKSEEKQIAKAIALRIRQEEVARKTAEIIKKQEINHTFMMILRDYINACKEFKPKKGKSKNGQVNVGKEFLKKE